ncbi:hypothetical protein NDU88_005483, partial [Pleurodeles waltl]
VTQFSKPLLYRPLRRYSQRPGTRINLLKELPRLTLGSSSKITPPLRKRNRRTQLHIL